MIITQERTESSSGLYNYFCIYSFTLTVFVRIIILLILYSELKYTLRVICGEHMAEKLMKASLQLLPKKKPVKIILNIWTDSCHVNS